MSDRDRFGGDMSRNEVEMDLSKFMEMIQENGALKDEIRELKANDTVNPWQKWIHLARAVDSWRIWSCILKCLYILSVLCDHLVHGITRTFNGTIWSYQYSGRCWTAWFGLYVNSAGPKNMTLMQKNR